MVGHTFGSIGVMMVEQDEHIGVLGGGGGPEGIVVACATAYKIRGETALVILWATVIREINAIVFNHCCTHAINAIVDSSRIRSKNQHSTGMARMPTPGNLA